MQRSFSVAFSRGDGAFVRRFPALANVPYILDSRPGFHRLANAFLVDRALGLWHPRTPSGQPPAVLPSQKSIHNYAQWLANFLEWADRRGVALTTCSYAVHVQGRYQNEMIQGTWARNGRPCKPNTVNVRVHQACEFLSWMVALGHRGPFIVPYETVRLKLGSATSSVGHVSKEINTRKGKIRVQARALRLPTDEQVGDWLERVEVSAGATSRLMCETVLLTAMRREEVVCLRIDTLAENPEDWHIANPQEPAHRQQVRLTIKFGTKGRSFGVDNRDKIGPPRSILMPLQLARKWDDYRRGLRNRAFKKLMDGTTGKDARRALAEKSVHLFLRESDGERFSGKRLYDDWVSVQPPVDGWSPHQGRHWWACSMLWREFQRHELAHRLGARETAAALLESTALSVIRLQIQPQLGHSNESTTMIYLRWVMDMLGVPLALHDDASQQRGREDGQYEHSYQP